MFDYNLFSDMSDTRGGPIETPARCDGCGSEIEKMPAEVEAAGKQRGDRMLCIDCETALLDIQLTKARQRRRRTSRPKYPELRDRKWLCEQYVDGQRSMSEIAADVGCAIETGYEWLHQHDIEMRGPGFRTDVDADAGSGPDRDVERAADAARAIEHADAEVADDGRGIHE